MKLPKKEVEHIAVLARISLTEAEKTKYADDLSGVLDYVEELKKIDIAKVQDVGQITGLENQMADDVVVNCSISRDELLKNAPMSEKGYIKVKSVMGRES